MTRNPPPKYPVGSGAHCRKPPWAAARAATGGHREDRRSRPGAQGNPGAAHRRCGSTRATNQPASARRQATLRARSNDMRPCRRPSDHTTAWLGLAGRWGRVGEIKTGGLSRCFLGEERKASIQSTYLSIFLFFAYRTSLSEQLSTPFSDRGISSTTTHQSHTSKMPSSAPRNRPMQHIDRKALYTDLEARVAYLHSFLDFGQSTSTPPPDSPDSGPTHPLIQSQPSTYTPFPVHR